MEQVILLIIGALIGIKGSEYKHQLDIKREDKKFYREKLEELITNLFEFRSYTEDSIKMILKNEKITTPACLNNSEMLVALYFPEIDDDFHQVFKTANDILDFVSDNFDNLKEVKVNEEFIMECGHLNGKLHDLITSAKETYSKYL